MGEKLCNVLKVPPMIGQSISELTNRYSIYWTFIGHDEQSCQSVKAPLGGGFVPLCMASIVSTESSRDMHDTSRVGQITAGSCVSSSDSRNGCRGDAKDCLGGGAGFAGLARSFSGGSDVDRSRIAKSSVTMSGIAKTQ